MGTPAVAPCALCFSHQLALRSPDPPCSLAVLHPVIQIMSLQPTPLADRAMHDAHSFLGTEFTLLLPDGHRLADPAAALHSLAHTLTSARADLVILPPPSFDLDHDPCVWIHFF